VKIFERILGSSRKSELQLMVDRLSNENLIREEYLSILGEFQKLPYEDKRYFVAKCIQKNLTRFDGRNFNFREWVEMLDTLEETYGEDSDLHLEPYPGYHSGYRNRVQLYLVIRFKRVTIRNSRGRSHDIYGLFIYIPIEAEYSSVRPSVTKIQCRRYKATREEIRAGYMHSHYPGSSYGATDSGRVYQFDLNNGNVFCTGNSSGIHNHFGLYGGKLAWKLFLLELEAFVSWESLEGGPHIGMSNIRGSRSLLSPSRIVIRDFYDELKLSYNTLNLNFIEVNNSIRILEDELFEDFLRVRGTNPSSYLNVQIATRDESGNWFRFAIDREAIPGHRLASRRSLDRYKIWFREEEIKFEVVNSHGDVTANEMYINPNISKYVKKRIEKTIRQKQVRGYLASRQHSINILRRSIEQNQVLVSENQ